MASATNTKKTKNRSNFDKLIDLYWGGPERRISGLTLRIIGINFVSLLILMLGVISLGRYETQILATKLESFSRETKVIAQTIARSKLLGTNRQQIQPLLRSVKDVTNNDIILFDSNQNIIAQTTDPINPVLPMMPESSSTSLSTLGSMAGFIVQLIPDRKSLPAYPSNVQNIPDIFLALNARTNISAWQNPTHDQGILLSGAAPVVIDDKVQAAVYVLRSGEDIVRDIENFWLQMLQIFLITLGFTIFISIYLSGAIARPLRKLTRAAESIRRSKSQDITIPDLSERLDEIGELSLVMRDMTEALKKRMDNIESFAADVAHELKNPLTSLKSAVETLKISKKKADREKLLNVLQHDIERMDRLISDISAASRLDVELARHKPTRINLSETLKHITDHTSLQTGKTIDINLVIEDKNIFVLVNPDALAQVFDNIIGNALSFAKNGDTITIKLSSNKNTVIVSIEDEGPGIPDSHLEKIFERFYTQRPENEGFGNHSGLGLAISQQIITAFGGSILAENKKSADGTIIGARFIVTLNKA